MYLPIRSSQALCLNENWCRKARLVFKVFKEFFIYHCLQELRAPRLGIGTASLSVASGHNSSVKEESGNSETGAGDDGAGISQPKDILSKVEDGRFRGLQLVVECGEPNGPLKVF